MHNAWHPPAMHVLLLDLRSWICCSHEFRMATAQELLTQSCAGALGLSVEQHTAVPSTNTPSCSHVEPFPNHQPPGADLGVGWW